MKIKMLDTVEDSHPILSEDVKPVVTYDIRLLNKGLVVDSEVLPGGEGRCKKLVQVGFAEEV